MLKRSTLFATPLLASILLSSGASWAASCAEVDSITLKVLADIFKVDKSALTPMTKFVGPLQMTEAREEAITSALEKALGISEDDWKDEADWTTVEDALGEVRSIKGCTTT